MSEEMKVDGLIINGVRGVKMEYPSNSHKDRAVREEGKRLDKVITGKAVRKKKSLGARLAETFISSDVVDVKSYVIYEILVPQIKSTVSDIFHGSIDMIFGGRGNSRSRRDRDRTYVSYSSYYKSESKDRDRRDVSRKNRARHNFDDIILETRGEAEEVIYLLVELIEKYDVASVADLYELVDIESSFTDRKYGWDDLSTASVRHTRDGYLLDLPKPLLLD